MADVAIVTDSNSGISVEEGQEIGVTVIPMPVHIDGTIYYEGLDITQAEFYDRLIQGADVAGIRMYHIVRPRFLQMLQCVLVHLPVECRFRLGNDPHGF